MKIMILTGSYRKQGNTASAAGILSDALQGADDGEVETIPLAYRDVRPCRGCRLCFDEGEGACPHDDDVLSIRAKMREVDAVIAASPIYVDDVSGTMKTWIDRMAFVCHRPEFGGKCSYFITTSAGSPAGHAFRTLGNAFRTWGFHGVGQLALNTGARMEHSEIEARYGEKLSGAAEKIVRAIRERHFENPSFFSLMTFKIQQAVWQGAEPGSLDYAHWKDRGWLDAGCDFYVPHRANPIKATFAKVAGMVIGRFVT